MKALSHINRRTALANLAGLSLLASQPALAQSSLEAAEFGVTGDSGTDQTAAMQLALDQAQISGQKLQLPPGVILVSDLTFPAQVTLEGAGTASILAAAGTVRIGIISGATSASFRDVSFSAPAGHTGGIVEVVSSDRVHFDRCAFSGGETGLLITDAAVTVSACDFGEHADAAIHSANSRGLVISGNRIDTCGNAGIRIWRDEAGPDGSIVSNNRIDNIDWRGGGNGQNGNGINVFKADEVIVADNHISHCAFSAIRLNSTRNTQVSGNLCLASAECAIFSEFAFSGSVIANNIVDGAATGISITNLDQDGHLAVCSGNIVRNITPSSATNPDTTPVGIYAEADTAVTGNTVSNVPGFALAAGYGNFLRNVLISSNVVTKSDYGVGVSVVDGCGSVHITSNLLETSKADLVGLKWQEIASTDLAADTKLYPHVFVQGNT